MAYIGRQLVRGQNRVLDDISSSFNGSTTAFNLTVSSSSSPPASVNQLWIILGGILQKPGTDFTVADAVITFTTAPASTLNFWGMIQGDTSDINSPADASVTPSKIANSGDFAFPADVRFKDADASHYVGLQAPSTVSSNLVWTLPAADGSANQLLKTDGSGALGWASDANAPEGTSVLSTGETGTTKYLRVDGDNTCSWQLAVDATKATLTGSTNNTITTVTGANAITGEANLTFNGSGDLSVTGNEGTSANLYLIADEGDDNGDGWRIGSNQDANDLTFANNLNSNYLDKFTLTSAGDATFTGELDLTGKCLTSFGGNSTNEAACIKVGYEGSSKGQIRVYGADASTTGSLEFKVCESDGTDDHTMLFDGAGRLLLGTTVEGYSGAEDLTVYKNGDAGITIRSSTSGSGTLAFSDGTSGNDEYRGYIQYQHGTNTLAIGSNATQNITLDSSGSVGLGTTPETDGQANSLYFANGNANIWGSGNVNLYTVVNARYTGTAWKYNNNGLASYVGQQSGVWSFHSAASGTADAAATFSEKVRIQAAGGISFNGDSAAANALDDYEEGTFTPAVTSGLSGGSIVYNSRSGRYTKVGNLVTFTIFMKITSCSLDSGALKFGALPFTSVNATNTAGGMWKIFSNGNIDANATYKVIGNATDVQVITAAGDAMAANATSIDAGGRQLAFWGFYYV